MKNTVLHYQRKVLNFPDQETALNLAEEAEASGMPAVYSPPARAPDAAIDLRLEGASRNERLCTLLLHHPAPHRVPRRRRDLQSV